MKTSLVIVTSIFCTCSLNSCYNEQPASSLNNVISDFKKNTLPQLRGKFDYDSIILSAEKRTVGGVDASAAFDDTGFIILHKNSLFFTQNAINFLDSKRYTNQQKIISIICMEDLPLSDYVKFCYTCKTLFDNRKIDESLLNLAFTDALGKTALIVKNFDNNEVITLLDDVLDDPAVSIIFKDEIRDILAGKYAAFSDNIYT